MVTRFEPAYTDTRTRRAVPAVSGKMPQQQETLYCTINVYFFSSDMHGLWNHLTHWEGSVNIYFQAFYGLFFAGCGLNLILQFKYMDRMLLHLQQGSPGQCTLKIKRFLGPLFKGSLKWNTGRTFLNFFRKDKLDYSQKPWLLSLRSLFVIATTSSTSATSVALLTTTTVVLLRL